MKQLKNRVLFALISALVFLPCNYTYGASDYRPYGLFGGLVAGTVTSIYDLNAHPNLSPSDIFKKTIGYSKPYMETFGPSRSLKPERYFASNEWNRAEKELLKAYGKKQAGDYIKWQKYLYNKHYRIETTARARFSKVSGDVGEAMMNRFYAKGRWEKIFSKIGEQGIDGLYIKRRPDGTVNDVLVAESKTGQSTLGTTKNGQYQQMSKKWIEGNLERNLVKTRNELHNAQNSVNKTRITDLQRSIKDLEQIQHRVRHDDYRAELFEVKVVKDKPYQGATLKTQLSKLHAKGPNGVTFGQNPIVKQIPLTQESGNLASLSKQFFTETKMSLVKNGIPQASADRIMAKLTRQIETGKISSSQELGRFMQKMLRAEGALQEKVAKRINPSPQKATLTGVRAHTFSYGSATAMGMAIGGLSTALMQYSLTGRVDVTQVAIGVGLGGGISVGAKLAERSAGYALNRLANSKVVGNCIGKALTTSALKKGGSFIPFGVGALVVVGTSGYGYLSGQASGEDAAIASAVGLLSIGATAGVSSITTAMLSGTTLGSVVPGIGTAVGLVVGLGIGVAHAFYQNNVEMQRVLLEQYRFAVARAEYDKQKSEVERQEMIQKGERLRNTGWHNLEQMCS